MSTTPPATPAPVTAPPPPVVTPLDPPVVYYNLKWKVAPIIVHTQEEADALDPTEWTTNPPPKAPDPQYPKLFYNINVSPKIIDSADEEKALSGDWREFSIPEALVKAAQAKIDAAANPPTTP